MDEEKGIVCPLVIGGKRIETEKKITSAHLADKGDAGVVAGEQGTRGEAIVTAGEAFRAGA